MPLWGLSQSPINISRSRAEGSSYKNRLKFHWISNGKATLKNTGHSAQIDMPSTGQWILNGPLYTKVYALEHLHFHWGTNGKGSEHSIDGNQ